MTPVSPVTHDTHSGVARSAVRLAVGCVTAFAVSVAAVALAYALGHEDAVEDTWLGALLFIIPAAALVGALAACILAVIAKTRHERWGWLWLALGAFPGMIAFIALAEAFVIE